MSLKIGQTVKVKRLKSFDGKVRTYYHFEAVVMALAKSYAMVRRPGCAPFVESIKDLEKWMNE